ncbi:MAG: extracellular solute-binding protein [Clostridiales bacterium]
MQKRVILFILIIGTLLSVTNCKKNNGVANKTTNQSSETEVTLELWIMPNNGQESENNIKKLAKPFLEDNPNVKLNITVLEWGVAFNKIMDAVTNSGEKPDITQLGTTWVGMMASQKPGLSDMGQVYNPNNFVEGSLSTTKILGEDKIFAIPWFIDTRLLYYRKDACEKVGINPKKDFDTWDKFKKSLEKLNDVEIDGIKMSAIGMPGKNDWNVPHNFSWWIWGAGGDFLDENAEKSLLGKPEAIEGIKFYTGLVNDGLLSKEALMKNMAEVTDMFKKGYYATTITDASLINNLKVIDDNTPKNYDYKNFGITMIPKGPKERAAFFGGSVLSILESSKNKQLAAKLVRQLTSKDAQVELTKTIGHLPALKAVYDHDVIKEDPMKSILKEQIKNGKSYPSIPEWGTIEAILTTELGQLWDITINEYSEEKIEEKVKSISENVDKVLSE